MSSQPLTGTADYPQDWDLAHAAELVSELRVADVADAARRAGTAA
jgi:hypothetical protein